MPPDCATHTVYTNNFTFKLIQIKRTVLTFAPVEKQNGVPRTHFGKYSNTPGNCANAVPRGANLARRGRDGTTLK
jgi:hypothetical protein